MRESRSATIGPGWHKTIISEEDEHGQGHIAAHIARFCFAVGRSGMWGIAGLERPFAKLLLPSGAALPVWHNFFVYHHWEGGGQGSFTERFEVIDPRGESVLSHPEEIHFNDELDFYDVLVDCRVLVSESGHYRCNVFLDGELVGDRFLRIILA